MENEMLNTVIFDLDDTLYEEIEYCKSGFLAVAKFLSTLAKLPVSFSQNSIFESLWEQFSSGNRSATFNVVLDKLGVTYDEDIIRQLVTIYRGHEPQIQLPAESRVVLGILQSKYTLALLSDGFLPAQELKVKALGIEGYFKCIIYTEALGREFWKPCPKGFEIILKKLQVKPKNCVYVADNAEKDFIAPVKLGIDTIQLVGPNRVHRASPANAQAAPGQIIGSIRQLPGALERL
jgi:putative hydrolase of the HAD superfamily